MSVAVANTDLVFFHFERLSFSQAFLHVLNSTLYLVEN